MKIVVAVRCFNEEKNIARFMRGYDFADEIVVSDGGSTDGSVEMLKTYPKDETDSLKDDSWVEVDNKTFQDRKTQSFPIEWESVI